MIDFLFNLIVISAMIAVLIVIWAIIIGIVAMFFEK